VNNMEFFLLLPHREIILNTDSENDISPDEIESSSSDEYSSTSSSPDVKLGCNDNCCKSINVITKSLNVLTKQEEQE
jgi:hypothetical protein